MKKAALLITPSNDVVEIEYNSGIHKLPFNSISIWYADSSYTLWYKTKSSLTPNQITKCIIDVFGVISLIYPTGYSILVKDDRSCSSVDDMKKMIKVAFNKSNKWRVTKITQDQ